MKKNDPVEWSVFRPPFVSLVLKREGKRLLGGWTALYIGGFLIAGVIVVFECNDSIYAFYLILAAAGIFALFIALFAVVYLLMWAGGYGYSYRLDVEGLSFRFFIGRAPPPPTRIPDDNGEDGALFGLFSGWVYWSWLREHGAGMATEDGYVILRADKAESPANSRMPAIYLFCGRPERMTAVAGFVGGRLG